MFKNICLIQFKFLSLHPNKTENQMAKTKDIVELDASTEEKIKFLVPNINYDKYSWGWLNGNTEFYCSYFITLNNEFYMVAKKH